jgi:hypothetical protein
MAEDAVDHVGDGLEPAVGVPGRALGLARGVVDLAHLVHVHERVEGGQVDPGEGAAHREPFPLVAAGGGGHREDGAVGGGRVNGGDAWQGDGVGADGWHVRSSVT